MHTSEVQTDRSLRFTSVVLAAAALALALIMGMAGCSSGGSASGGNISTEDKTDAKQVVMAAGDMFTIVDLGLTDEDSPVTISQSDPQYAEFFNQIMNYKKVADLDVSDVTIKASIEAVGASTAREDVQTNYRYTITDATMTIDGKTITYSASKGFNVA